MDMTIQTTEQKIQGISLIIAPLLFALSTFFWKNGEYGVTGGTIFILSFVFWVPAFTRLFGMLRKKMPRYASWGLLVGIFWCIIGVNFGFVGIYSEVFSISHKTYIQEFAKYPVSSGFAAFLVRPFIST